jgi:pimeloyl-ACP methyl ester carboxylesterase
MKRILALATSAALLVTGLSAGSALAAPDTPAAPVTPAAPAAAETGYVPPAISWKTCSDATLASVGAQCGNLVVPLDYGKPKGKKLKLAVSRVKHQPAAGAYQGVMLVNPGGPGGSGLIYSVFGTGGFIPGDADLTYDWIGFDPRGVGSSSSALSCNTKYFGYDRPNFVPTSASLERAWLKKTSGYAKACGSTKSKRQLLAHVKTTDSVKDLESLRKALGQKQINFYGFSYGTYLAQVYMTKHPSKVRRFVMDGNVDPRRIWYPANLDQDRAFEKTSYVFFAWLAKNNATFGLGSNADSIRAGYYRQLAKLDKTPAQGKIGPDELNDVLVSAAYYVYDWVPIGQAYADLVKGDATAIRQMYADSYPTTKGSDNNYAMYLATSCTDAKWPQKFSTWRTDNWRVYAKAPFLTWNNAWYNMPCKDWRAKSGTPVKVTGKNVKAKILLINETLDPATPYTGALEVRRRFPTASLIEGVGGTTHSGSLSGIACTDNAIAAYLANGTVPARRAGNRSDLQCPPVPQPDPTAAQRRAAPDPLKVAVRKALKDAQLH